MVEEREGVRHEAVEHGVMITGWRIDAFALATAAKYAEMRGKGIHMIRPSAAPTLKSLGETYGVSARTWEKMADALTSLKDEVDSQVVWFHYDAFGNRLWNRGWTIMTAYWVLKGKAVDSFPECEEDFIVSPERMRGDSADVAALIEKWGKENLNDELILARIDLT